MNWTHNLIRAGYENETPDALAAEQAQAEADRARLAADAVCRFSESHSCQFARIAREHVEARQEARRAETARRIAEIQAEAEATAEPLDSPFGAALATRAG